MAGVDARQLTRLLVRFRGARKEREARADQPNEEIRAGGHHAIAAHLPTEVLMPLFPNCDVPDELTMQSIGSR